MPPSDDSQGPLADGSSTATHEPSTVMAVEFTTSATTTSSSTLNVSLQDQLSDVFEAKMTAPMLQESPRTTTSSSETGSSCSSETNEAVVYKLRQQQPSLEKPPIQEENASAAPGTETAEETYGENSSAKSNNDEQNSETPLAPSGTAERLEQHAEDAATSAASTENEGPLSIIRKGAVAAVGGTMVGVGLVMIPLPTPFGAVIASSGLAVLGTEFKEAKEMNDKLIDGAKKTVKSAREKIVKSIQSMEADDFDADEDTPPTISKTMSLDENGNVITQDTSLEMDAETTKEVVKVAIAKSRSVDDTEHNDEGVAPQWLHMNPIERQRQERLAREKYRRENLSSFEQARETLTRSTGRFLSRNLLPLLREKQPDCDQAVIPKEINEANIDRAAGATAVADDINAEDASKESDDEYVLVRSDDEEGLLEKANPTPTL